MVQIKHLKVIDNICLSLVQRTLSVLLEKYEDFKITYIRTYKKLSKLVRPRYNKYEFVMINFDKLVT